MTSVLVLYYFGAGTVTPRFGPPSRTPSISWLVFFFFADFIPTFKAEWAANSNQYLGQTSQQPVTK